MKKILTLTILLTSSIAMFSQNIIDLATRDSVYKEGWLEDQAFPGIYKVSIIQLIANPESFNEKRVMISGYLSLEFEGSAIYLNDQDYELGIAKNGVWVRLNDYVRTNISPKDFSHKYVTLIGTFNSKSNGYEGMWSGSLDNVYSIRVIEENRSR